MIPNDLNIDEFAQNLAGQAQQALPADLPDAVKKTITEVVYAFIKIAGDALKKEKQEYNIDQTVLICQLVGEWMYHKGIDNYKNQIPQEYWKPVLQQIAFSIFEVAKNAVLAGQSQDEVVNAAEVAVHDTYQKLMQQLANENKLTKSVEEIMQQSNLHDYVEQNYQEEQAQNPDPVKEEKALKLMTTALFFKTLSPEEVGEMVKMLSPEDKREILTYINMPDLEKLVDPIIYKQYLDKFNNFMPKVKQKKQKAAMFSKLTNAFGKISKQNFELIIADERSNVKNFLLRVYNGKMSEEDIFPHELTNTIVDYVLKKVQ